MPLADPGPIESARLVLRLVAPADLPALLVINGDDETTRYLPYAAWRSMADAEAWHGRMERLNASGLGLQFVVVDKATGAVIGSCLLFRYEEGSALAELGYVMGRAHAGRGLMREALVACIGAAFTRLSLRRLEAQVDPRNQRSAALALGLGFVREGLLRERWLAKGEAKDVEIFGLLRHEWRGGASP